MRLNKYLSECGIASRRKADEIIEQGRVTVNKKIASLGTVVDPKKDTVEVDGEKLKTEKKVYFLLNKPMGTISTTDDENNRVVVTDLIRTKEKIFPVGRLDFNTTGVLLLTNDGELSNYLTHPRNNFKRVYSVKLDKELENEHRERLLKGVKLENRQSKFTDVKFESRSARKRVLVETEEGRNHFVKNMFQLLGYRVNKLDRVSFAGFTHTGLKRGEYRIIKPEELLLKLKYRMN